MRRIAYVGVAAVLLGVAALVDVAGLRSLLIDDLFVPVVGAIAALAGIRYVNAARGVGRERLEVEAPEPRYRSGVLGEDVEEALAATGQHGKERRTALRRHLQGVAEDVLVTHSGYDREAAAAAVVAGTWTGDDVAAGYLAEPVELPGRMELRNLLVGRRATVRRCVDRTLDAIEEVRSQ